MWINGAGYNYTSAQIVTILSRNAGCSYTVEELERTYRVGRVYQNGSIWFQRVG